MAIINNTLNKAAAAELFAKEAILFGDVDAVPEHRIVELFGEWAGKWFVDHSDWFVAGRDYNLWGGSFHGERPFARHLYRDGFNQIVSEHNYRLTVQERRASESGKIIDALWDAKRAEQEAREAEEERQRQERKAKRAAARAAKQAAQSGEAERE